MSQIEQDEFAEGSDVPNYYFSNPQIRNKFDEGRLQRQKKEIQKVSNLASLIQMVELVKQEQKEQRPIDPNEEASAKNYATVALFCLSVTNPFRMFVMKIVFNKFILLVIMVNCVFLAINDPNLPDQEYQIIADFVFLCIFTMEMTLKIIVMGFALRPFSYLRDAWNILDFVVVVMGWVSKVVTANNVSAIRVIRILRPLRTINSIPTMKKLVQSLLNSLPTIVDVFVLLLLFHTVFGTIGTQLFGGLLDNRCFNKVNGEELLDSDDNEVFCLFNPDGTDNCISGYQCIYTGSPEYDCISFDSVLKSMMNVFVIITLRGWTDRMYFIRRATGTYWYDCYFILTVIIGVFFILNIMIAAQISYFKKSFLEALKLSHQQKHKGVYEESLNSQDAKLNGQDSDVPQSQNVSQTIDHLQQNQNNEQEKDSVQNSNSIDCSPNVIKHSKQSDQSKKKKCSCLKNFQAKVSWLIESRAFNIIIILFILGNALLMAMEHYDMNDTWGEILNYANTSFTCVFAVEMVLKLIGMGFKNYMKDGFNDFDSIIVLVGMLEFFNIGSRVLTVLRAFRLLRIFKIVKSWKALRVLLMTVLSASYSIANLGLLIFLLSFIYALIGMQFLSGPLPPDQITEFRQNFNSFWDAMLCMFITLTAENWNITLTQFIFLKGYGSSVFFISNIILANTMLLNMFMAILISYISDNEQQEHEGETGSLSNAKDPKLEQGAIIEEENDKLNANSKQEVLVQTFDQIPERTKLKIMLQNQLFLQRLSKNAEINKIRKKSGNQISSSVTGSSSNQQSQDNNPIQIKDIALNIEIDQSHNMPLEESKDELNIASHNSLGTHRRSSQTEKFIQNQDEAPNGEIIPVEDEQNEGAVDKSIAKKKIKLTTRQKTTVIKITGRSLYIFAADSKFRRFLKSIIKHIYFENFIYQMIGLNTLILAATEPSNTDPYQNDIFELMVDIISAIFVVEAVLKILVMGFVMGKTAYLKDNWNKLDFIIVLISVLTWILTSIGTVGVSFIRGFRALRALRPLRMVSKNEGMKIVVDCLLKSIPQLFNVLLINLLFFLVFGILGVQFFKGSMGYCTDDSIQTKQTCVGFYKDDSGVTQQREWVVPFVNYDTILSSTMTFFEICTQVDWPDTLFATIDSVGYDQAPKLNNRPYVAVIFVVFIFLTTFFVMNLFASVIVDTFNEEMQRKIGTHSFTPQQREWVKMQWIMLHAKLKILPVVPTNRFRQFFFKLVMSQKFEMFIIFSIAVNTIFICLDYYNDPPTYAQTINIANYVFIGIFACEALFKNIAHGPKFYFLDNWNKYDFAIVILSLFTADQNLFPFKVTSLRFIRVARLFRMIRFFKGLRHLVKTMWFAGANVLNVAFLLCLIFITFAIAGMQLFGNDSLGGYLDTDANFQSLYITFILLFRCLTGEGWNGIMHEMYQQHGVTSIIYWLLFQLSTHYFLMNVLIAVVYDSFTSMQPQDDEDELVSLKMKDVKAFMDTWAMFCPHGEHYMKTTLFSSFLLLLPSPLGYEGQQMDIKKLNKIIRCLNIRNHIKDNEGKVYFPEVMWVIFHSVVGNNDEEVQKCEQVTNIMKHLKRKFPALGHNLTPNRLCGNNYYRTELSVTKYLNALRIVENWKRHKRQKEKMMQALKALNVNGRNEDEIMSILRASIQEAKTEELRKA